MAVGENIIFDPTGEELSVADAVLAVSVAANSGQGGEGGSGKGQRRLTLLSVRMVDTPARLTGAGVPDEVNSAMGGGGKEGGRAGAVVTMKEIGSVEGVWRPPRGGVQRGIIAKMIKMVMERGGVAEQVLDGLEGVDL